MASAEGIKALHVALGSLIDGLRVLTMSNDVVVAKIAASLMTRLTLALQTVAFGPSEWQAISDGDVASVTDIVNRALDAMSHDDPSADTMVDVAVAVGEVIGAMDALR